MATARAAIVPVTPFQQNCTLLWDETTKAGAVVDPGGDVDAHPAAHRAGRHHGREDPDHPRPHRPRRRRRRAQGGAWRDRSKARTRPTRSLLRRLRGDRALPSASTDARTLTPDRWLDEGDTVTVAGPRFRVLHCPGHSPGSVVLLQRGAALRTDGRRAVSRLGRPHRPARRQTTTTLIAASRTSSCRSATTWPSSAATARPAPSARSGRPTRSSPAPEGVDAAGPTVGS